MQLETHKSCAGFSITTNKNTDIIKEACLSLPSHSTVFQSELCAMKEACNQMNNQHIIIWTDSFNPQSKHYAPQ